MNYLYLKQPLLSPQQQLRFFIKQQRWHQFKRLIPTILTTIGASLIISTGYPIISYELNFNYPNRSKIISPIPQEVLAETKGLISPINPNNPQALASDVQVNTVTIDYTKLNNWFPFSHPQTFPSSRITHYTLNIPKLRITDALVTIGGDNLNESLIHYAGTANPGEFGNTVIFGHSILPTFYNPRDYRAIFSLLPTLKTGDNISIYFDGINYQYTVLDYYEVSPDEVDILEQRFDRHQLTLVTCVPPGTYWRRGIIRAALTDL